MSYWEELLRCYDSSEIIQKLATNSMPTNPDDNWIELLLQALPELMPLLDDFLGVRLLDYIIRKSDTTRINYSELVDVIDHRFALTAPFHGTELARLYFAAECEENAELVEYLRPRLDFMELFAVKYDCWCSYFGRATRTELITAVDDIWGEVMNGLTDKQRKLHERWIAAKNSGAESFELCSLIDEIIWL
jgi:hypothetical protein